MAEYLYRYLNELNAKTIIVEYEYTDGDFLDDFASYYVKCFTSYERRCKRLHFFNTSITEELFLQIVRAENIEITKEDFQNSYLGFIVARPLPETIIGRTVLRTFDDDNRRNYPCTREYTANLFGIDLKIRSLAFQEQDTVLAACATVALWCAFNKTRELFGLFLPTPAEITRSTSHVLYRSRPIPSHGLNVQQMCTAIRHVGLEPEVVEVKESTPLVSLIYGHLRMGLPVILAVKIESQGGHAITLNGYSLTDTQQRAREVIGSADCAPMVGLRIDKFYSHDDQIGPFARLDIKPSASGTSSPVTFDGTWKDLITGKFLEIEPHAVIIPVYHKIRVTFQDVHKWIYRLHTFLTMLFPKGSTLEWDIFLTTTNDFKLSVKAAGAITGSNLQTQLLKQHPKYIWRSVLRLGQNELVEVLADATDMARSFPIYEMIWYEDAVKGLAKKLLESSGVSRLLVELLTRRFFEFLLESVRS
jgi:hypothetical protein